MQAQECANSVKEATKIAADLSVLRRDTATRRVLARLQSWAKSNIVEPGRGTAYVIRRILADLCRCSERTLRRALAWLRDHGWIRPGYVVDAEGREHWGYIVAVQSSAGFRPPDDPQMTIGWPVDDQANTMKPKEKSRSMGRTPAKSPHECQPPVHPPKIENEPTRERDVARRVAAYERERRASHPRAQPGDKDRWPDISASTRAIRRLVADGWDEARLCGLVDLRYDRAASNSKTWTYWSGISLWTGSTPGILGAWLDEPTNMEYVGRHQVCDADSALRAMRDAISDVDQVMLAACGRVADAHGALPGATVGEACSAEEIAGELRGELESRGVRVTDADRKKIALAWFRTACHKVICGR